MAVRVAVNDGMAESGGGDQWRLTMAVNGGSKGGGERWRKAVAVNGGGKAAGERWHGRKRWR